MNGLEHLASLLALSVAVAGGCAPSAGEMKQVKGSRYTCDYSLVFGAAVDVVAAQQPPVAVENPEQGMVASAPRWHEPTGMRKKEGAVDPERGDVVFYVHVALVKAGGGYTVEAVPHVVEQVVGSPRGREMSHDDANWPGWADGKADRIASAIHERLKGCAAPS